MDADTLFPLDELEQAVLPARIRDMHTMYGLAVGRACGECAHLETIRLGGTYFKCALSRYSRGPATDWRKRWPACGKFEEATHGR